MPGEENEGQYQVENLTNGPVQPRRKGSGVARGRRTSATCRDRVADNAPPYLFRNIRRERILRDSPNTPWPRTLIWVALHSVPVRMPG